MNCQHILNRTPNENWCMRVCAVGNKMEYCLNTIIYIHNKQNPIAKYFHLRTQRCVLYVCACAVCWKRKIQFMLLNSQLRFLTLAYMFIYIIFFLFSLSIHTTVWLHFPIWKKPTNKLQFSKVFFHLLLLPT